MSMDDDEVKENKTGLSGAKYTHTHAIKRSEPIIIRPLWHQRPTTSP